jgi:hypothetical protein
LLLRYGGMDDEDALETGIQLPRYVRFARSLALLSGAAGIGFAAGVTLLTAAGCGQSCNGICGVYGVTPAVDSGQPANDGGDGHALDAEATDGPVNTGTGGSGGPLPAPPLPPAWLA